MPRPKAVRRERPWVALVSLMVGSGTAFAAPLLPTPPRENTGTAPWLWRVQSAPGPTNAASVSLKMLPDLTVGVGSKVSFGVTARKAGYLVLVDVDAEGRMSQIFPTPELLAQSNERDINYVRPGVEFVVPTPVARQRGFEYVISPPTGSATVVAILSERRVQLLDLPDMPRKLQGKEDALSYLSAWTSTLRVPDAGSGKLLPSNWSFDVKPYSIR
ncbi:DUF4384 domain-containing protein [Bradyrhizobium lablabi]|uniref:DUF4384 domain-containing protein n=1 Tax=Bradyrhizobium lablabi TaxID=722472 RepID=UPI001BA649EB|nr:DUF4384 domain-containing protein [Bradyrhizobium lablabi]MBR0694748.1 DUF4384 domain-containing protein [Bradyrhizobium lablabi]